MGWRNNAEEGIWWKRRIDIKNVDCEELREGSKNGFVEIKAVRA